MEDGAPDIRSYLPPAVAATVLVVAMPAVAVWALRSSQLVSSTALAVVIGAALSVGASYAGSAYWVSTPRSRDVLFSELMLWGWLRRWRAERRLSAALADLPRLGDQPAGDTSRQSALIRKLAHALEAGDPYTHGHSRRVARYAVLIARRLGLPADEVDRIRLAAAIHDVGKVETPVDILHKPGRLTDEEYAVVKRHPVAGARLVQALGDDRLTAIVLHHHERLDGGGYPSGLSGIAIPLGARIIAVADTFDAITSARPYRPASPHRRALAVLAGEVGTQLDADAVYAFRACYTGRRPLGLWLTVAALPNRLAGWLGGSGAANAASIAKVVAVASTAAVAGGAAAIGAPLRAGAGAPSRHGSSLTAAAHPEPAGAPAGAGETAVRVFVTRATLTAAPPRLAHARRGHRARPRRRTRRDGAPATAVRSALVRHAAQNGSSAGAGPATEPSPPVSASPATSAPAPSTGATSSSSPPTSTPAAAPSRATTTPATTSAGATTPTTTAPAPAPTTSTPAPTPSTPAPPTSTTSTTTTTAPTTTTTTGAGGHPGGGNGHGVGWGGGYGGGRGHAGPGHS